MAQQVLLKYINFRQTFSHLVYNSDYLIPSVNELISNGLVHIKHYLFSLVLCILSLKANYIK